MLRRHDRPTHPPRGRGHAGLAKSELLGSLPPALLNEVAARSSLRTFRRGDLVFARGAPSSVSAVVVSGRVKCWIPGHESRQWVNVVVRPGGACGLAAAVDGSPHTCNAEPLERSRVVLVSSTSLRTAMERSG